MVSAWQAIAGVSVGMLLILILYLIKSSIVTSVWRGDAQITVVVSAREAARLERTVRALVALRSEKALDAHILIETRGRDEEFIRMAGILSAKYDGVSAC